MRTTRIALIAFTACLTAFLIQTNTFAQPPQPQTSQEMSGMQRTRELEEKRKELEKEIRQKKEKPQIEEKLPAEAIPTLPTEKVFVKTIKVTGATLVSGKELGNITKQFEGKKMGLAEMQNAADLITEAYRKKGYITSRAYLPPQKIENDTFEIRVIEGKMGDLDIKGNYYYKSYLYKKNLR